ncbi:MAG: hydroxymethylglutaryl-CoA reductase [Haliscomenobacter sp.]|nr:hydroxymethylglutaryl-CoA reductase [Haliscomenobacter sp.]
MQEKSISGLHKLSKEEKMHWLAEHYTTAPEETLEVLRSFWHEDEELQRVMDGFSENTLSNYFFPYGIAPNFLVDGHLYAVPMVIEESSVVAAAASAAKYWLNKGGFKTRVLGTTKLGQLHFSWFGDSAKLQKLMPELRHQLLEDVQHITANMEKRGGGVLSIELLDMGELEPHYFQLRVSFETCDSMGANFINSVLEEFGRSLQHFMSSHPAMHAHEHEVEIIMAILSNYTPDCIVRAEVSCPIEALDDACINLDGSGFAEKFAKAVRIAEIDPYRATTHNKGIYNGVDAVVIATGNDFRATEACGHTYAARDGQYRSLSHCRVEEGVFTFWLDLPIALGTVGGLTKLHPLAHLSLEILGQPSAPELMSIIAATGLAQNFAAVRSLVTTGIQKGHMKMHLMNILNHLGGNTSDCLAAEAYFQDRVVSFSAVREFLDRREEEKQKTPAKAS